MSSEKLSWFQSTLKLKGSVIPAIAKRVLVCGAFGVFISVLYYLKMPLPGKGLETVVPSIVLGLLLVFRTNTAYDRFWEGRKLWGNINNNMRNLARILWVSVKEESAKDRAEKEATLWLLVAFGFACKLHLRSEPVNDDLEMLMSGSGYFKLRTMKNPPLEIAVWIGDYLEVQNSRNCLNVNPMTALNGLLNGMVEALGGCERILKTPMPLAYAIHLKQLLLIYCLLLPFQLVANLEWATGPIVTLISFTLFGIEQIGVEIEDPFGYDANDLPLDAICDGMRRYVEDLIALPPQASSYNNLSPNVKSE